MPRGGGRNYKYNNTRKMSDGERTVKAIGKATGKRMMLKPSCRA